MMDENEVRIQINKHGDHEASCLCCDNLSMVYDAGYSNYTPGEGAQFSCDVDCFYDTGDISCVHDMARTCPKFKPRGK